MTSLLLQQHLQAIVTVLALVNPLMCGALFARSEDQQPRRVQIADAAKAASVVLIILVLAALFGVRILQVFGVSLDAFSVAGGGVLSWIGFSMLASNTAADHPAGNTDANRSLTPLIVFAASPGTITGGHHPVRRPWPARSAGHGAGCRRGCRAVDVDGDAARCPHG